MVSFVRPVTCSSKSACQGAYERGYLGEGGHKHRNNLNCPDLKISTALHNTHSVFLEPAVLHSLETYRAVTTMIQNVYVSRHIQD